MTLFDKTASRFAYIDALRGWAILMVMVGHCGSMTRMQGWLRTLTDGCMMGIYLFFVISAFTIFHMFTKHTQTETEPVRNFFIRRFFRIAPLYWFAILLYTLIWEPLPDSQRWHYFLNFFLLNALNPETHTSVVPGGWSISIEVIFYLSVPLLFPWLRSLRQAALFLLICVFIFPPVTFLISRWADPMFAGVFPLQVVMFWDRFPLNSIGCFAFGIWFFYLTRDEKVLAVINRKGLNIAVVVSAVCVLIAIAFLKAVYPPKEHFYSFIFMALALMLSAHPWKIFVNRFTVFIGRISYSLYVVHFAFLTWLYLFLPVHTGQLPSHRYLYFAVYSILVLFVSVPAAWLGYQWIERPAIECSRRLIEGLEKKNTKS